MSIQEDSKDTAHLEQVNAELAASLQRCRSLLSDCRTKLAANSNDPPGEQEPGALTTQPEG